tara:strand:+ start:249 stop:803 length:555 start_codon:yes stop_codon:yes gene_type:complete
MYFFSLITPPNKDELITKAKECELDEDQNFHWGKKCVIKQERLNKSKILPFLIPSYIQFQNDFKEVFHKNFNVEILEAWRNTYFKGYFQEIHDHMSADLSAVLFLNNKIEGSGEFFFYNRHQSELGENWAFHAAPEHSMNMKPNYRKGDILFFPSYMLHGVTPHKADEIRTTLSFNFSIKPTEK